MVVVVIIKIVRLTKNSYTYLLVFSKINKKKKKDQNVIHNIADHYARVFDVFDRKDDLMKLIENHGNQPFYIFRYLSLVKNFLIVSKILKYTIEVPSRKEYHFLEDLKKKCFMQVIKRRAVKEPLDSEFLDEIYLTINVLK